MKRLAFLAAALACLAATAHAAEITVLSGGAVKSAFTEAAKA